MREEGPSNCPSGQNCPLAVADADIPWSFMESEKTAILQEAKIIADAAEQMVLEEQTSMEQYGIDNTIFYQGREEPIVKQSLSILQCVIEKTYL